MAKRVKVFFDTEFTGLHQDTSLISIGCVSEDGRQFYAELSDYDQGQVDEWIQDNVIAKLRMRELQNSEWGFEDHRHYPHLVQTKGPRDYIAMVLTSWLGEVSSGVASVEMWGDVLAYDWVLFCQLFGGATKLPSNIYYIPFDIATLLALAEIDPDINRQELVGQDILGESHTALYDALLTQLVYQTATEVIAT